MGVVDGRKVQVLGENVEQVIAFLDRLRRFDLTRRLALVVLGRFEAAELRRTSKSSLETLRLHYNHRVLLD